MVQYNEFTVAVLDKPASDFSREYGSTDGRPVIVKDDLVIRGATVVDILGHVWLPVGPCKLYSWQLEPLRLSSLLYGVEVCPGIVRMVDDTTIAAVRIANWNKEQVIIPGGTVLAILRVVRGIGSKNSTIYRLCGIAHLNSTDQSCCSEVSDTRTSDSGHDTTSVGYDEEKFSKDLASVMAGLPEELSQSEKFQLEQVLTKFKHVVAAKELGCTTAFQFDIDPGCAQPVCHRDRRFSPLEHAAIKSQMERLG